MNHYFGIMALLPKSTVLLYNCRPNISDVDDYRQQFYIPDGVDVAIVRLGTSHDLNADFDSNYEDEYIGRAIYLRRSKLLSPIVYIGPIATTMFSIPIDAEEVHYKNSRSIQLKKFKTTKVF